MPSSEKTNFLKLNQWSPEDKPQMEDFNQDNQSLEDTISAIGKEMEDFNKDNQLLENSISAIRNEIEDINASLASKASQNIYTATCSYDDGVYVLSNLSENLSGLFTVRFVAPETYNEGDNFSILGNTVSLHTQTMETPEDEAFKSGAVVQLEVDMGRNLAFFKNGGGVSSKTPPEKYTFYTALTASGEFVPPESEWYKIYVVGKSGYGGTTGQSHSLTNGTGGGGSGGISAGELYLKRNQSIPVTVTNSTTSFGAFMSATAGSNGHATGVTGGNGGIGAGGNVGVSNGYKGGDGGAAAKVGSQGANKGMLGGTAGTKTTTSVTAGGGGGGGARYDDTYCPYVISTLQNYKAGGGGNEQTGGENATMFPLTIINNAALQLYGGGSGWGGKSSSGAYGGGGHNGTPGVIIIEKGVR